MTAQDELDRRLAAWMTEAVSSPPPVRRFELAMAATAHRRPRPHWLAAFGSDWVGTTGPRPVVWAWPGLRRALIVAATVALLVAALVGIQVLGGAGSTQTRIDRGGPVETPSPASTATIAPDVAPAIGGLEPGTYTNVDLDGQGFNLRFTVPAGWSWSGRYLSKGGVGQPGGAAIFFVGGPVHVYVDPCHWAAEPSDPENLAVDTFMADLVAQPLRGATTPTDRRASSLFVPGNWAGLAVELTVPGNVTFAGCDGGEYRSWGPGSNARSHQGSGQRDLVWAVDLSIGKEAEATLGSDTFGADHQRIIVDAASFPGTPADVISEIDAILASIVVGHWG